MADPAKVQTAATPQEQLPLVANPLFDAGFDANLYRSNNPFVGINPYGKKGTYIIPNNLDNRVANTQFADTTVATEKLLPRYTTQKSSVITLGRAHYVLACDTTANAITITLPNAANYQGHEFVVAFLVDGGNNVIVQTDQTDNFGGAGGNGTDLYDTATFEDKGDFLHVIGLGGDTWFILSEVGGTYTA